MHQAIFKKNLIKHICINLLLNVNLGHAIRFITTAPSLIFLYKYLLGFDSINKSHYHYQK